MHPTPDELLALRRRDPETLRSLVTHNTRRLYRAARGMGLSAEDADDLVQDVFVTFLGSLDRFEGRASVDTWLYGILLRKVQERRRSIQRDARLDPMDEVWEAQFDASGTWVTPPMAPDRSLSASQIAEAIAACLDDLAPLHREVFVLRQVERLPARDVSSMLEVTVSHIGVLLHRARTRMRQCLDLRGWSLGA